MVYLVLRAIVCYAVLVHVPTKATSNLRAGLDLVSAPI